MADPVTGTAIASRVGDVSDEGLAQRGRDVDAFAELYRRYRDPAYRIARRYSSDDDDTIDVVAASFEHAFAQLHTFDPARGSFAAWLLRITRNLAIDSGRRRDRFARLRSLYLRGHPDDDRGPEAIVLARDDLAELRRVVAGLSPVDREALALRYGERLSAREIATVTGRSVAATEKTLSRALAKVRKELNNVE